MKRVKKGDTVKIQFKDVEIYNIIYPNKNGKTGTVIKVSRPIKLKGYPFLYTIEMPNKEILRLLRDEFTLCK